MTDSGESFQRIAEFFERDRFASGNGMHVVEVRLGYARTEMTVEPRHMNSVGILQGGALFTLADLAFAGASNSHGVVAVAARSTSPFSKRCGQGSSRPSPRRSPARTNSQRV